MVFLGHSWVAIGYREELVAVITEITNIDSDILRRRRLGSPELWRRDLSKLSVAKRVSWAADRVTTRPEDKANSLMGIFNVNMPVLYGEGATKAFHRLQLELIRDNNHTIFAWGTSRAAWPFSRRWESHTSGRATFYSQGDLLASSPDDFIGSDDLYLVPFQTTMSITGDNMDPAHGPHFYRTNYGIRMQLPLAELWATPTFRVCCALPACITTGVDPHWIGMLLCQPAEDGRIQGYSCVKHLDMMDSLVANTRSPADLLLYVPRAQLLPGPMAYDDPLYTYDC